MYAESDDARTPFVSPAWWDPKRRKIILDPSTYVSGLLLASDGVFSFVSPEGVVADGSLIGASATWPALQQRFGAPVLDLQLADGSQHKLFFSLPHRHAPRLSKSGLEKIGGIVKGAGSAGHSAGTHLLHHASQFSDIAQFMHFAGVALQVVAAFSEQKKGRDSLREFLKLITPGTDNGQSVDYTLASENALSAPVIQSVQSVGYQQQMAAQNHIRHVGAPARAMLGTTRPPMNPPPGWYLDQQGWRRWWDGVRWTAHTWPSR